MSTERRPLQFNNLDQVVQDLDQLLTVGYTKVGNWDLAQTCRHLDDWLRFSLDGYPKAPAPIRLMIWLMKVTIGRRQFKVCGFRDRLPTIPETVHSADLESDSDAAQRLAETISRFESTSGPIQPSPLYGPLTYDEATQLHLIHCAHHLRFLKPNSDQADGSDSESEAPA
jgi:hypothetical protein